MNTFIIHLMPHPPQDSGHSTIPVSRLIKVHLVHQSHVVEVLLRFLSALVENLTATEIQKLTLPSQADLAMVFGDHRPTLD